MCTKQMYFDSDNVWRHGKRLKITSLRGNSSLGNHKSTISHFLSVSEGSQGMLARYRKGTTKTTAARFDGIEP